MEANKLRVEHNGIGKVKSLTPDQKKLYDILVKLPRPPKDFNLTKDQKKWWSWFAKEFLSTKKMVQGDLIHLQNAAVSLDQRNKIIAKINKKNLEDVDGVAGWVQEFSNGTNNVTGYQSSYDKATKQLNDISEYFGLSFAHRQKINNPAANATGQLSLLDQINEMLNQ
jgi:phage terminase small subunit